MQMGLESIQLPVIPAPSDLWELVEHEERITKQQERAQACRHHMVFGNGKAFGAPCGAWQYCLPCYKYRVQTWYDNLKRGMADYPGNEKWYAREYTWEEAKAVRRSLSDYSSFPLPNGMTRIISPQFDSGEEIKLKPELLEELAEWVCTPHGKRATTKGVCDPPKKNVENKTSYDVNATPDEFAKVIRLLDGKMEPYFHGYTYTADDDDIAYVFKWFGRDVNKSISGTRVEYGTIYNKDYSRINELIAFEDPEHFFDECRSKNRLN